jgi:trigger factor
MNITKRDVDNLNAVLTIEVDKEDYADKVEKTLKEYRKNANVPGFRKGQIPMGMIKKQHGRAVLVQEVNKVIQDAIQNYLTEEKLNILGYPIPSNEADIDWNKENFTFEFKLGLSPEFDVNLQEKEITHYKITIDEESIDNQVKRFRKQYGKIISQSEITEEVELNGKFTNADDKEGQPVVDKEANFSMSDVAGEEQRKALLNAKHGETITLNTKGLFKDEHMNQEFLGVSHEEAHGLDIDVNFEIKEIVIRELAEMNQEFFDKIFGEDTVHSEEEMREKIKESAEAKFQQQSDQKLLDDVIESLIENTKFELPEEFLIQWLGRSGEQQLSDEEAKEEYKKNEKGLRYQLIEGKLREDHNINITFEELKAYAKGMMINQMAQYGILNPDENELEQILARTLSNREEVERLTEQVKTNKLLQLFKEKALLKTKEVTFNEFVEEAYA